MVKQIYINDDPVSYHTLSNGEEVQLGVTAKFSHKGKNLITDIDPIFSIIIDEEGRLIIDNGYHLNIIDDNHFGKSVDKVHIYDMIVIEDGEVSGVYDVDYIFRETIADKTGGEWRSMR